MKFIPLRPVVALLLFWWTALHFLAVMPAFEGPDEPAHFGYVTELRRTGRLPDASQSRTNLAQQASAQGPVQYALAAVWSQLAPAYTWDGSLPANRWHGYIVPLPAADNPNYFLFGPDQLPYAANPGLEPALRWQRLLSPLMGVLAAAAAYAAARLLLNRAWALFVMLVFAFNPVQVQSFAILTNDASAHLFAALSTCQLVYLLRRRVTLRALLVSGLVFGTASLTKASLLVFAPVAILGLLLRDWRNWKRGAGRAVLLGLPFLAVAAPWYLWNAVRYHDALGVEPHMRMGWAFNPPRSLAAVLADGLPLPSLWSGVGWGGLAAQNWIFIVPVALLALSAIGYARGWRGLRQYRLVILALALVCLGMFAALLRWLTLMTFVSGRLLLPAYLALALLVTLGLAYGWGWRVGYAARLFGAGFTVFMTMIALGGVVLGQAFTTTTFPPEAAPPLHGERLRFGEVEFMGYRLEPPALAVGVTPAATACWQSQRDDERLPVPYAFAFQLTAGETVYYGRESYPGMGSYTNWQPGRAFCDRFKLDERQPLQPGRAYRVTVSLFDPATGESLPEADGKSQFVGWTAAPGPALTDDERAAALYDFGGLYLLDAALADKPGRLVASLAWGTGEWTPAPVTLFIHVMNGDTMIAQADVPLGGDDYPAALWGRDERAYSADYEVALPDDLPGGDYEVYIGLYRPDTMARLPIMALTGDALVMPDNRIQLVISG